MRDYDENLGASLYEHLRSVEDLVVIADEHHSYFGPQFLPALPDLSPQALIGLTATPHPKTDPAHIVFHYPLAEAIADGYVKVPVLVARRDGSTDIRRQLADGVILLKHKADALAAYAAQTGGPAVNPVMFLVCSTIEEANEVAEILVGPDFLGVCARGAHHHERLTRCRPRGIGSCGRNRLARAGNRVGADAEGGVGRQEHLRGVRGPAGPGVPGALRAGPRPWPAPALRTAHRQPDARHGRGAVAPQVP